MNKNNIKIFITLVTVFILLIIIAFIISTGTILKKGYIIIDEYAVLKYKNNNWHKASSEDISWKKFTVYSGNKYVGKYKLRKSDRYYFFDDKIKSYDIEKPFIAFSSQFNVGLVDYSKESFNDDNLKVVNNYLKKKKINYNGKYNVFDHYLVDLNNDNKVDSVYVISNQLYSNKPFYIVFAKIGLRYVDISIKQGDKISPFYGLKWVITTKNNGVCDIILNDKSSEKTKYYLLRYYNGVYSF